MTADFDDFMSDLFFGCAFAAYIDQAAEERGLARLGKDTAAAYRYYEEELARRSRERIAA